MQYYGIDNQQNLQQYQNKLLRAQVKAAPSPQDVAMTQMLDNFDGFVQQVGGAALGGAMGGGGGMGGMMGGGGGGGTAGGGSNLNTGFYPGEGGV